MEKYPEKTSLRRVFLEKRDSTSDDLIKIHSEKIHNKLKKIEDYQKAKSIGFYYPIGSEVITQKIISESLSEGKIVLLPKVVEQDLSFRKISSFKDLEKGVFDIMEPKDDFPEVKKIDVIIVPTVAISPSGIRLGYGHGFYDRFLKKSNSISISLTYEKQIVKSIPVSDYDVKIDWVVTEDRFFKTS